MATAACGASQVPGTQVPAGQVPTARPQVDEPDATEPAAVAGGSWTGTITLHGVINQDETKDITSGDVGSTYYQTGTSHDTTQVDVTDTFAINGKDPEDVSYGIDGFDFSGTAANAGTTLERYVQNWNSQNSGCTYKEEVGTQVAGSWNSTGTANGKLNLNDDGSYTIDVSAGSADPNGEEVSPALPHRVWDTFSDISAGCVAKSGGDVHGHAGSARLVGIELPWRDRREQQIQRHLRSDTRNTGNDDRWIKQLDLDAARDEDGYRVAPRSRQPDRAAAFLGAGLARPRLPRRAKDRARGPCRRPARPGAGSASQPR